MQTSTELIAREGWKLVSGILVVLALAILLHWVVFAWVMFVLFLCTMYFYRNVERIPEDIAEDSVLAPIDGIIKDIENKENRITIIIKKPICFCGMLRMPFAKVGKGALAVELAHTKGLKSGNKYTGECVQIAFLQDEELANNQQALKDVLENQKVKAQLFLSLYPRNFSQVVLYFKSDTFKLGERIGFFLSGNAVFEIPLESQLKVNIGDKIYAGQTLFAKLH